MYLQHLHRVMLEIIIGSSLVNLASFSHPESKNPYQKSISHNHINPFTFTDWGRVTFLYILKTLCVETIIFLGCFVT
jgi:hypothetical protein